MKKQTKPRKNKKTTQKTTTTNRKQRGKQNKHTKI